PSSAFAQNAAPIVLRDMGSFHIGGRYIELNGQPISEMVFSPGGEPVKFDPNGKYQVEQMYAQYFLVQNRRGKLPLLMWHGGGLSGVTYETKPDGSPGWLNYFLRQGWDTYISDAMERGRSGWTDRFKGDPVFLPLGDPWERFRVGPIGSWNDDKAKRVAYPGVQFPIDAYEQFMKQGVPRWVTTDEQIIAAYIELVDKVCPCVVLVHSQAGAFGFKVAEARPDKVKALVAVEPSGIGDKEKVAALKNIPIAVIYGDNAKDHPRWGKIRQNVAGYADAIRGGGGSVDLIDLPDVGIKGNTHMAMMDRNSDQVAEVIQKWFERKGLVD
ncbi:MAG TPA: esterase, partial [Xanthobacteraceae bacterium]|nr:esterase [Xanthobacteraceae bacterium]